MRVAILTFGCRVNQAESQAFERELWARGAEVVTPAAAELVLVNSCSVTATADQGTRQSIRRVARENPSARIVVTGCYATRAPGDVAALPGVVHLVPNERKDRIVEEALRMFAGTEAPAPQDVEQGFGLRGSSGGHANEDSLRAPATGLGGLHPAVRSPHPVFHANRTTVTLRVQTGCEESCSYCVIPSTRGAERSTPVESLVAEARRIEAAGYCEVTLTGVHLGSYGRDLGPPSTLASLVHTLIAATRKVRFRLGSLEPMDCPAALIEHAASGDRLAPAFHLPLQHASDGILQAMRRPYTRREYDAVVRGVRERVPHASITADVIVGFPGETDRDFDALAAYLEGSPLTQLHVFPYSDRPGTEASSLEERVHGATVRERARIVRDIGARLAAAFRASQAGSVRPALTIEDGSVAVTDNGLRVRIPPGRQRNEWVHVELAAAGAGCVVRGPLA